MRRKYSAFDIVNGTVMMVVALICVYPLWNIFVTSISNGREVLQGQVYLFPKGLNIETYRYILTSPILGVATALMNSFIYVAMGATFNTAITYMTAYALSKKRLAGRNFIMLLFIFAWVFESGIIPSYLVNDALGLVNNRLVMFLPIAISTFLLVVARTALEAIPQELEESAFIDGANDFQIMTKVYLPLSGPTLATLALFYSVQIWNSFLTPAIYLQRKELQPIQLVLNALVVHPAEGGSTIAASTLNGFDLLPQNINPAVIFLAVVPILFAYPFAQKYFVKGMLAGSVKG